MLNPSVSFSSLFSKNQNRSAVKKSTYAEYLLDGISGYPSISKCVFHQNSGFRFFFNNWIILATLLFFLIPSISLAAQVTLEWEPNSQSPEGYYVFHRVEGDAFDYDNPVWPIDGKDHTETKCTIEGLTEGVTYYFIVRAYLGSIVSVDSNEVSYQLPSSLPAIHTISASSGANGNIKPSAGDISVNHGGSQTFYFIPDSGYEISVVTVDGQSIGSPSSYTFSNVILNHSITVAYAELMGKNIPQANEEEIRFEAEDGDIYSPIVIADDPKASEGGYIHAPAGSLAYVRNPSAATGYSEYIFDVSSTGDYAIWGRVNATSSSSDSFYVAMDDGSYLTWHVLRTATDSWAWDVVCQRSASDPRDVTDAPFTYHLQAGFHKLTFATREAGTKLDQILITSVAGDIPTDMPADITTDIPTETDQPSGTSVISKTDWRLVSVDSEELVGEDGAAVNAFDDNPGTIWHTQWADASPTHPHELVIDLGNTCQLDGFSLLPRQDGGVNGRIIDYAFYVGDHPDQWSAPVVSGRFANTSTEKSVTFGSAVGRYIRLVALSESFGSPWTSVAEIGLKGLVLTEYSALVDNNDTPPNNDNSTALDDVVETPGSDQDQNLIPSKTDWRLVSVDSEEQVGEDGAAVNAFDDNPGTIWHTQWADASPTHPHELVIDLGNTCQLDGFSMLPRQDGSANGRITDYEFYVGDHPDQWSAPVASGRFDNTSTEKSVTFGSAVGRYIRLVALSESYGNPWTSVAEISVTGPGR